MMAVALALTACSGEDNTIETSQTGNPKELSKVKTIAYSVTVNGGNATTRATVDDNNKTLRFAAGDVLYIASDSRADLKGALTLKAGDAGKTSGATFEGSLTYTGDAPADDLTLKATLVGSSNAGIGITDGKVTGITYPTDAFCSSVNDAVEKYSLLTGTSTYAARSFSLSQSTAFLNFAVRLTGSVTAGTNVTATVKNGATTLSTATVTAADVSGTVTAQFVLPVAANTVLSGATVTINNLPAVSFGGDAAKTLSAKVYNVARGIVDLSTLTAAYTAQNGDLLTGTLANNVKISIADKATVTLDNVTINGTNNDSYKWAGITCEGDATIILKDGTTNSVKGFHENYPGIYVPSGKTLTIQGETAGTGKLIASSNGQGAGIGGGYEIDCGNIEIKGGDITATGGASAAGIGSGYDGTCGNITISGGKVTANGGSQGAGIGSGNNDATFGNIEISGGMVEATGGNYAAGIGCGYKAYDCGKITIRGGSVTATGGTYAAGIGTGYNSAECGDITIANTVTKVTATKGGDDVPNSIGIGYLGGTVGTITIGDVVYSDGITDSPYTYKP